MGYMQVGIIAAIIGIIASALGIAEILRRVKEPTAPLLCVVIGHKSGKTHTSDEGHYYAWCDRCSAWHPKVRT